MTENNGQNNFSTLHTFCWLLYGEHDADSKVENAWLFVNDVGGGAVHPQGVEH